MPQITANGIALEYESRGDPAAEAVLLIMGLGGQLTRWSPVFIEKLAARGYRVIAFDNRDVGLSQKFESAGAPDMGAVFAAAAAGQRAPVAYTLDDMAADAVGLLDALGVARAHIVGASMGGMIAQLVAADYPERTLSLTSIMSTTGAPGLPPATADAMAVLNSRGPDPKVDLNGYLDHAIKGSHTIGSPAFPADEAELRARILADYRRSFYPIGFLRQYAAIVASPQRRPKLATITAPAVVVHGAADPLVRLEGGRDTAAHIRGAELRVIEGMGHDFPPALHDTLVEAIESAASRARAAA